MAIKSGVLSFKGDDGVWRELGQAKDFSIEDVQCAPVTLLMIPPEAYRQLQKAEDPLSVAAIKRRWENASTK